MTGSQVQNHGRPVERASRIESERDFKSKGGGSCMKYIRYRKISTKLHHSENRVCVYLPVSVDLSVGLLGFIEHLRLQQVTPAPQNAHKYISSSSTNK